MSSYSRENHVNMHGIDIDLLKKEQIIKYQTKRLFGVDYNPPIVYVAKVVLNKPFSYAPNSWAIQVINLEQDKRLKDTHVMYKDVKAVDVEDIIQIGL